MHILYIVLNCCLSLVSIVFIVVGIFLAVYCAVTMKDIKEDIETLKYDFKRVERFNFMNGIIRLGKGRNEITKIIEEFEEFDSDVELPEVDFVADCL